MIQRDDEQRFIERPSEPIDRLVEPFARFLHVEAASGIVLLLFTAAALANLRSY